MTITMNFDNGVVATFETAQEAFEFMAAQTSATPEKVKNGKHAKQAKSEAAKAIEQPKEKAAPQIEVKAKYERMANTAIARAQEKHDVALKLETSEKYNKGKDKDGNEVFHWAWLRCTDGKLNRDNGKEIAACMPKGWVYSPRRNAIRRDMGDDIRKGK